LVAQVHNNEFALDLTEIVTLVVSITGASMGNPAALLGFGSLNPNTGRLMWRRSVGNLEQQHKSSQQVRVQRLSGSRVFHVYVRISVRKTTDARRWAAIVSGRSAHERVSCDYHVVVEKEARPKHHPVSGSSRYQGTDDSDDENDDDNY